MHLLVNSPVSFINSLSPLEVRFVIFCATTLGLLMIAWVIMYMFVRQIPNKCIFAPFENVRDRLLHFSIILISSIGAYAGSVLLKEYFQIGRPDILNFNLQPLLSFSDYGFPSSHAAVYSAIAASMFLLNQRAGIFATLLALIIGTARIFAGVHTPLDIVGGYLLGVLAAILVDYIALKVGGHEIEDTAL
ncbi:MAG: phosphatase PAP2 family protein [Candidatus Pacebacteria bacterium]|nr:phosphatase PAP2 family protein [Candidatus Paceibacterota bacterium]